MTDPREALVALLWERFGTWPNGPLAAWLTEADCARFADAILAAGWTPPTVKPSVEDVAPTGHDHEWQRRQNVTSRGYRMTPYEVCVVDGCDAARQVVEPATPTTLPSVEDVARVLYKQDRGRLGVSWDEAVRRADAYSEWHDTVVRYREGAAAVLALLPGRTEAEVHREGYDQGLRDAASASRSEAEVKAEALDEAAYAAVTEEEGIPWDHDYDRATVGAWLGERAEQVRRSARGRGGR